MGLNYFINPVSMGGSGFPSPTPMGTLFDFDFTTAPNLNDFTVISPNGTIELANGYLRSTQTPGTGAFGDYLTYNAYGSSIIEKWDMEAVFIPRNLTANSYGMSLGMRHTQGFQPSSDFAAFMQTNSGAGNGKTNIYLTSPPTALSTSGGALIFSIGDRIKLNTNRDANILTLSAQNLSNPNSSTISYTVNMAYPSTIYTPVIGKPSLYFHGGIQDVEYFKFYSSATKNAHVTFFGDSITAEYGVPTIADRWPNILMAGSSKSYNVCAAPSATVSDLLLCQNEIALLNSKYNVICLGVNDQAGGTSLAISKAALESLLITVPNTKILNYLIPFYTHNPNPWNAMIDQIRTNTAVNLTDALGQGSPKVPKPENYNLDLLHLNAAGAIITADTFATDWPQLR